MSSAAVGESTLKLALVQLEVGAQKSSNLERAGSLVRAAANNGAKLVTLPVRLERPAQQCGRESIINVLDRNVSTLPME